SNIMDALDNLPYRPDIAFEFYWKAIDNLLKLLDTSSTTSKEQLQFSIRQVWIKKANNNEKLNDLFSELTYQIKSTSAKYLYKRLYENYDKRVRFENQSIKSTRQLLMRLKDYHSDLSSNNIYNIIEYIGYQYGYDNRNSYEKIHKGSRFLMLLLKRKNLVLKNNIEVNGRLTNSIKLNLEEQFNFMINGLLYTFRNDRFHGNIISPFRSSLSKFETYSHPFYCLIWAELLLLLLLEELGFADMDSIIKHCTKNLNFYKELFVNID
ncbi:MAG: hypothetical protein E6612_12395, partial [Paeniclostridium sordellii]|nr:hypothetical protein [Paeniclostridium sordellii]